MTTPMTLESVSDAGRVLVRAAEVLEREARLMRADNGLIDREVRGARWELWKQYDEMLQLASQLRALAQTSKYGEREG